MIRITFILVTLLITLNTGGIMMTNEIKQILRKEIKREVKSNKEIIENDYYEEQVLEAVDIDNLWARGYYCGSAGHVSQEQVKRYIQEQEGKDVFEYDIYNCPQHLKGQLKIGDFVGD